MALDEPLSELLLDVASTNPGVDHCRVARQNVLSIQRRVEVSFQELQLELVVADGEVPVEEEHALDPASPTGAQSLPLLLVPIDKYPQSLCGVAKARVHDKSKQKVKVHTRSFTQTAAA